MAFNKWITEKLTPAMNKFGNIPVLRAIRSGFYTAMPIILIGAFFEIVSDIALLVTAGKTTPIVSQLSALQSFTFGLLGIIFAYGIAASLAKYYRSDATSAGLISICLYFLLIHPTLTTQSMLVTNLTLDSSRLAANGMFVALVGGLFTGWVYGLMNKKGWVIKGEGLPDFANSWFGSLIPAFIILIVGWVVAYPLNIDLFSVVGKLVTPIIGILDTYPGMMILGILGALCWFLGIHPGVLVAVVFPLLITASAKDAQLFSSGIAPYPGNGYIILSAGLFVGWLTIGGTGSTLGLNIWMLRSKSKTLKAVGRVAIVPSLLNINEPIIFGIPAVYNPIICVGMMIINGLVLPVLARLAIDLRLMSIPHTMAIVPFLPIGLVGFLQNQDWRGVIVALVMLIVSVALWYPFFKLQEQKMLADEKAAENQDSIKLPPDASRRLDS
jgi:PTS system cellobiose-specific IIC component